MSSSPEIVLDTGPKPVPPVWGAWATLGFSTFILSVFVAVQTAILILFGASLVDGSGTADLETLATRLESDGFLVSLTTLATAPFGIAATVLCVRLCRGSDLASYLALYGVSRADLLRWLAAVMVLAVLSDTLTWSLGRPIVPEFMVNVYASARSYLLLWAAMVIAAPLFEEVLFRGFVFAGLSRSRLGPVGAVVLSSAAWAFIHFQYDLYGVSTIFVVGLLLGWARVRSGSLVPCIVMHAAMNVVAVAETALLS